MVSYPDLLGLVFGLASAIFMSIRILFVRKATVNGEPLDALYVSVLVAFSIFFPISMIFYYPDFGITLKSFSVFLLSGVLGTILATAFYFLGTKRVGASLTAPVRNASLLVTVFIAIFILNESITRFHLSGVVFVLAGVVIIARMIGSDGSSSISEDSIGNLSFPLGAMVCFGLADALIKLGLSLGVPIWVGLAILESVGLILLTVYFLYKGYSPIRPFRADERYYYLGSGLALSMGLLFLFLGLRIARLVVVVPLKSLAPLFVIVFSYFFLRHLELINRKLILGTILIVIGTSLIGVFM